MKKPIILLILMLMALTAVGIIAGSAKAQETLKFEASILTQNTGVSQDTAYTFTLRNTGQANLASANITIPIGYHDIRNLAITQQPASQNWNLTLQDNYILLQSPSQGLATGENLAFTFQAINPPVAGNYRWSIGANNNTGTDALNTPEVTITVSNSIIINSIVPAIIIFVIAAGIAFLNTGINRVLINYFVGWEQYRIMQKEMAEYRAETMAAARANDKKQMEKLKKKQSQMNNMQAKMLKPQMVQFGISFLYLFVWFFVLTPTFGGTSMVYIPGLGPGPVLYWYPICSFFLGLLAQRIIGVMPIEQR
ncbi:MAG: EMC3/TMCO1 family protein [Candidatus Bathyarchaeota archaeon]|nr:EMC3/TMCO1 family protein [Candidatus Bathyarchaeota archaeon]